MKLRSKEALREAMDRKNVSLDDLRRAAGVSKGFISHLTAGRKNSMTPIVAYRIAERLDVPVSVLFEVRLSTASSESAATKREAA